MISLSKSLQNYVVLYRNLGLKFREQERELRQFVSFMEDRDADRITCELALEWAKQPEGVNPARWAYRLSLVRAFSRFLQLEDPRTEVPPYKLIPARYTRPKPYIYTPDEIQKLMAAAKEFPSKTGLKSLSIYYLIGLLASTGLRIGEALALTCDQVDLDRGLLTIKGTKNGKSRLVPLHSSTQKALSRYAGMRDEYFCVPASSYFFVSERGNRLWGPDVRKIFYELSREVGLRGPNDHAGPRLHDARHYFVVQTLLRRYRSGEDIDTFLPILSTYLGHCNLQDTFWYLQACPELMSAAVEKLDSRWEKSP
jgi:integrase